MTPRLLLHRLSLTEAEAELIPTTADALRTASFIDGRTDFSSGPVRTVTLPEFLRSEQAAAPAARMVFNTGFCGSTLLARLIDVPGQSLVLREPNCLADLANQRAASDRQGVVLDGFGNTLSAVTRHLSRPWAEGETIVVKPSSWANSLVPMIAHGAALYPLFLVSTREQYLKSVFRGGPARLAFAARAAVHLSSAGDEEARLVDAALRADEDQIGQLVRAAVTGFEIQLRRFRAAALARGWGSDHWLEQSALIAEPKEAVGKAARALALDLDPDAIAANVDAWAGRHAKNPSDLFSYRRQDEAISAADHNRIAEVLGWAAAAFDSR